MQHEEILDLQLAADNRSPTRLKKIADWISDNRLVNNTATNFLTNKLANFAHPISILGLGFSFPVLTGLVTGEPVNTILGQTGAIVGVAGGLLTTSIATQLRTSKEYRGNRRLVAEETQKQSNKRSDIAKTELHRVKQRTRSYVTFSIINAITFALLLVSVGLLMILAGINAKLGFGIVQLATILLTTFQAIAISTETYLLDKWQSQIKDILTDDNEHLLDDSLQTNLDLENDNEQLTTQKHDLIEELAAVKTLLTLPDKEVQEHLNSLPGFKHWHAQGITREILLKLNTNKLDNISSTRITELVRLGLIAPRGATNLSVIYRQCLENNYIYAELLKQPKEQAIETVKSLLEIVEERIVLLNLDEKSVRTAVQSELLSLSAALQLKEHHINTLNDDSSTLFQLLDDLSIRDLLKEQLHTLTTEQIEEINAHDVHDTNIHEVRQMLEQNHAPREILYTRLFEPAQIDTEELEITEQPTVIPNNSPRQ